MSGITSAFKDAIKKHPEAKTVVLSSGGGMIVEGLALANVIRKHGLNTHSELVCASACTFAFLAGKERSIAPTAAIGFHQSSRPTLFGGAGEDTPQYAAGDEVMRAVYADAGLDQAFVDSALKTPSTDMWFPSTAEILAKKIATRTSAANEFAVTAGEWKSAGEMIATLGADPVFKAARESKPTQALMALSEAWHATAVESDAVAERKDIRQAARTTLVRQLLIDADDYSDDLLGRFIAAEQAAWDKKTSALHGGCESWFAGGFPVDAESSGALRARQDAVLLEMIRQPTQKRVPGRERFNEADTILMTFYGEMIAAQPFDAGSVQRSFCREPGQYYDVLVTLPPARRVSVFRSLALTALRQSGPRLPFTIPGL